MDEAQMDCPDCDKSWYSMAFLTGESHGCPDCGSDLVAAEPPQ